jgi:HD-GYP domain-containing protein (c-di-GMP phosphodiesterase class II)
MSIEGKLLIDELIKVMSQLKETSDVDQTLKLLTESAKKLTNSEEASILLLDDDKKHLYFKVATGEKEGIMKKMKVEIGKGIAGWVAAEKKPLLVNDTSKDERFTPEFDKVTGFKTRSLLGVPIILNKELIGVAEVLNKKNNQPYTQDDQETLTSLMNLAAAILNIARIMEEHRNFFVNTIEILSNASETKDKNLVGHSRKIAERALLMANELNLSQEEQTALYYASLLHDLGYILSPEETLTERVHPRLAAESIRNITSLANAANLISLHHTSLSDGNTGIPSNILYLLEEYEERRARGEPQEKIEKEIKEQAGKKYMEEVVGAFFKVKEIIP